MAKLPIGRDEIIGSESVTITQSDLKGKTLAVEIVVALPILAPISRHGLPSCSRPLYGHSVDITCAAHVRDQNKVEVGVTIDCEPHSTFFHTWYSTKGDRDDSSTVLCDLKKGRFRHVEMLEWRVAPAAIVVGESKVRRAEVGGSDSNGSRKTPFRIICTSHFEASPTT